MARGNQFDYVPGFDYPNNIQQVGMFYWDTTGLQYVRWSGSSTTPDVAIANFPAVTTVTGSLTTSPPDITTTSYATPWFLYATQSGSYGISGTVGATQSGVWNVGINTGAQVAIASVNGNIGVSGNVGATQSGAWAVGVSGGNIAATQSGAWAVGVTGGNVAATQSGAWNVGVLSGNITATLSGTNYIIATLSTSSSIVGGVYPVSGLVMNERANIVPGSISFGNATTTGYITLVAAQGSGILTRVLSVHCMSQDYNTVALFSGINGTGSTITSTKPVAPYGGWIGNFNPQGWCETGANQALSFYQSVATATGIDVTWATTS